MAGNTVVSNQEIFQYSISNLEDLKISTSKYFSHFFPLDDNKIILRQAEKELMYWEQQRIPSDTH